MGTPLRVLLVEDSEADAELLLNELGRAGYAVTWQRVQTAEHMKAALEGAAWDVVLSDYSMPTFSAPAALAVLQATGRDLPFIIISGTIGEETAVAALKAGAHDFLIKGRLARLAPAIERELREIAGRRDRVRLQEQLLQAQKMEAIGQLAGGIAHDFNNVLTSILGYSELLLEQIGADKPMGQDVREIRLAAQRAAALTRQLLAFSRKQVLAVTPVSLTTIAQGLEPMLGRLLGERVRISTVLADNLEPVLGDATQLEHLLINLCVNARDAMPQGGVLTITTRNVELDEAYVRQHSGANIGPYAMMSVADSGSGMSPEILARIFEPFFTTKERGRGTGLGLAAVYGTVKQLNGYIDVESELGRGSQFRIYLPTTREVVLAQDRPAALNVPVGTETILVVEDESAVRAYVKILLSRFGYRVLDADSAEAALAIVERRDTPLQLLLTDVVLPRMDGRELALRVTEADPKTRVLFMSGYTDDWTETAHLPIAEGVHLIQKPFSAQALLSKVAELLGHQN